MRYVLDASVALKWVLPEPDSDKARQLREDYTNHLHDLIAPDSFPLEVAHPLAKYERRGLISDAESLWELVMMDLPALSPSLPLMRRAIQMAKTAHIGVYDCLYVALAEQEGCELITADDRLQRSLPGHPILLLASLG